MGTLFVLIVITLSFLPSFVVLKGEFNPHLCPLYVPKSNQCENTEFSYGSGALQENALEFVGKMAIGNVGANGKPWSGSCAENMPPEEQVSLRIFMHMLYKQQASAKKFQEISGPEKPDVDNRALADQYYQRPYAENYINCLRERKSFLINHKKEEPLDQAQAVLAVQDSRVVGYEDISYSTEFSVKNTKFTLEAFLGLNGETETLLNKASVEKGTMLIFRLSPQDPHSIYLPFAGQVTEVHDMDGFVSTVAFKHNSEATTVVTHHSRKLLKIDSNGKHWFMILVGSHCGGGIHLEEKIDNKVLSKVGGFSLFGSTVVVIFPKHFKVKLIPQLAPKSKLFGTSCKESYVQFGQPVAKVAP